MFWLLVCVFWFSLLFGTYVTGNGLGNWIALIALLLVLRQRRRSKQAAMANRSVPPQAPARLKAPVGADRPRPAPAVVAGGAPRVRDARRRWR